MPRPPGRARAPGPLDDLEGAPPPPTLSLGARRARSSPRRVVAAGSSAHMDAKVKRLAHRRVPDPHEADPVPHDSNLGIAGGDHPILYEPRRSGVGDRRK